MTSPEQITTVSVAPALARQRGWRRIGAVIAVALALGVGSFIVVGGTHAAAGIDAVAVPQDLVPTLFVAAKSCPTLTAARLAAQAMAASSLDSSAPMGIAGLSDAVWQVWAPVDGALRSDARASLLGLAHLTCDLVGHIRAAGIPGDQWRLAVAASQSSLDAVISSGGEPSDLKSYVDRVEAYATEYALHPELGGPGLPSAPGTIGGAAPNTATATTPISPEVAPTTAQAAQPSAKPVSTAAREPVFVDTMRSGTSRGDSISIGLVVGKDGKCLHVDGNRDAFHAPVQIFDCAQSEFWSWRTDGTLRTRGYCLSSVEHGGSQGTLLQLDTCTGSLDQVWNPNYTGALYNTGSAYCLDVPFGNTTDGTQLWIWGCNRSDAQTWSLTPGGFNGQVRSPVIQGACLEVGGPSTVSRQVVQVGLCNASLTQRWTVMVDGKLRSTGSSRLCLEVIGQTEMSAGAPGTAVGVNTCVETRSQTWAPQPNGSLQNPVSHLCLSAPTGAVQFGTALSIEKCDGTDRQKWTLPVLSA